MSKSIKIVVVLILALIFSALWYNNYYVTYFDFEKKFNDQRKVLGVPLIEESFVRHDSNPNFWINSSSIFPQHSLKELQFEGRDILIERDDFVTEYNEVRVKIMSYYHFDQDCFNFYRSINNGSAETLQCDSINYYMSLYGFDFTYINCTVCDDH
jgi:hypothetical protein